MLKIGQNFGKIANYPPYAQQRFAPLLHAVPFLKLNVKKGSCENTFYGLLFDPNPHNRLACTILRDGNNYCFYLG